MPAFNLKQQNVHDGPSEFTILKQELRMFDVNHEPGGFCKVGDELLRTGSLRETQRHVESAVNELRSHIWEGWKGFTALCEDVAQSASHNVGNIDNLFFLLNVKKMFKLSNAFEELDFVQGALHKLFDIDIMAVDSELVAKFNSTCLEIRMLHYLIMYDKYRLTLIQRCLKLKKQAQISGPWANLDLPMAERVWSYEEDEEYFADRQKARREQTRYNPEVNPKMGFFYVWQDLATHPYKFGDMKKDSPYKSRHLLTIP